MSIKFPTNWAFAYHRVVTFTSNPENRYPLFSHCFAHICGVFFMKGASTPLKPAPGVLEAPVIKPS